LRYYTYQFLFNQSPVPFSFPLLLQQHGIDKSVKIQVDTDSNKFELYQQQMASALFGRATWSNNSPTVNDVTLPAEFMLKFAVEQCKSYASWSSSP
jgi:hypothetical protein